MRRRAFIAGLGGAAVWSVAARAQPARIYRIGVLETLPPDRNKASFGALLRGLHEHGYIEGQNLQIEYRSADGHGDRFPALVADLIGRGVDLIVTRGTPAAKSAKAATATIPIVMAAIGEPLGVGVVASLAQPGGNVTGFSALKEIGYIEGRNLAVEYRGAEGHSDLLPALAADLVGRNVTVIVTIQGAAAALAAKAATSTIPIVFSIGGDAVKLGLVSSLNRPGANVTGTSFLVNTLGGKRLEPLRELMPSATVVGLLVNPKNPASESETADTQAVARALGLEIYAQNASSDREIDAAFANFVQRRVDALTIAADALFYQKRDEIVLLAGRNGIPTVYFERDFAVGGGLMSYSGSIGDAYRFASIYTGRILKGENPASLPVIQSTKIELVINLKTAKTLGVAFPLTLLGRADEVIE